MRCTLRPIAPLLWTLLAAALPAPRLARASDHQDGPAATMAPETDLGDLYVWLSKDKMTTYLLMTAYPSAGAGAKFSDQAAYVFHLSSRKKYRGGTDQPVLLDVLCRFDAAQRIQCWAGAEYVGGDASALGGVISQSGQLRVYAGRREDPAFFNRAGFDAFRGALKATVAAGVSFDMNGCPVLPTREALLAQLRERPGLPGSRPLNAFARQGALALLVAIDTGLVSKGGPIIGAWAATHRLAEDAR